MGTARGILSRKGCEIYAVEKDATVYDAIDLMAEKGVGSVLAMDDDVVCGILTERDYLKKVALKGRASRTTRVAEIMSSPVRFASPDATVQECMAVMTDLHCRHLPVGTPEAVEGMLSIGDLVKQIILDQEAEIGHLHDYIHGPHRT